MLTFVLSSCMNSSQKEKINAYNSVEVDLSAIEGKLSLSEFIESAKVLLLSFPDNEFLGRPTQACFSGKSIFVLDKIQRQIYHFDSEGAFVKKINRLGQGPEEYIEINNIMVKDETLYVCDKISNKINLYSFDGNFIKSIKYEDGLSAITVLPDGSFLCFTPDFLYNGPLGLWQMSDEGKYDKTIMEYTEKYPVLNSQWSYFYPISTEGVGIACPATNRFMHYDKKQDKLVVDLELKIKQKNTNSFPGIYNCISIKEPYWACPIYANSDNYIFGIWTEYNGRTNAVFSLYSKKKGEIKCYKGLNTDIPGVNYIGELIVSNLPNSLVTYFPEEDGKTSLCIYKMK